MDTLPSTSLQLQRLLQLSIIDANMLLLHTILLGMLRILLLLLIRHTLLRS
jgi:hypothetical protein